MFAPKVPLMKSTVSLTYVSLSDNTSAAWFNTSDPISPMNTSPAINTLNRMNDVPAPLRQPRACRRFTPGSMASARNNDTSSNKRKPDTMWNNSRTANAPRKATQKMTIARGTHFGIDAPSLLTR